MTKQIYIQKKNKEINEWARKYAKEYLKYLYKQNDDFLMRNDIKSIMDYIDWILKDTCQANRFVEIAEKNKVKLTLKDGDEFRKYLRERTLQSYKFQSTKFKKAKEIVDSYQELLREAEKIAQAVDISDIENDFWCGDAFVYISDINHPLAKSLRILKGGTGRNHWPEKIFDCKLDLDYGYRGQSKSCYERRARKALSFLEEKGLPVKLYTWDD